MASLCAGCASSARDDPWQDVRATLAEVLTEEESRFVITTLEKHAGNCLGTVIARGWTPDRHFLLVRYQEGGVLVCDEYNIGKQAKIARKYTATLPYGAAVFENLCEQVAAGYQYSGPLTVQDSGVYPYHIAAGQRCGITVNKRGTWWPYTSEDYVSGGGEATGYDVEAFVGFYAEQYQMVLGSERVFGSFAVYVSEAIEYFDRACEVIAASDALLEGVPDKTTAPGNNEGE